MTARNLDTIFLAFARDRGIDIDSGLPVAGLDAMLDFYAAVRLEDCDVEDGDMLLFQWVNNDWGQGEYFEVDLTRQVILTGEHDDDALWQLHLTYLFTVSERFRSLGEGEKWCASPGHIEEFRSFIDSIPAYRALTDEIPAKVSWYFERAG